MHVVGHGIDLVDIAGIRRWIEDSRDPLIPRCFVQAELDEIGDGGPSDRAPGRSICRQGGRAQGDRHRVSEPGSLSPM